MQEDCIANRNATGADVLIEEHCQLGCIISSALCICLSASVIWLHFCFSLCVSEAEARNAVSAGEWVGGEEGDLSNQRNKQGATQGRERAQSKLVFLQRWGRHRKDPHPNRCTRLPSAHTLCVTQPAPSPFPILLHSPPPLLLLSCGRGRQWPHSAHQQRLPRSQQSQRKTQSQQSNPTKLWCSGTHAPPLSLASIHSSPWLHNGVPQMLPPHHTGHSAAVAQEETQSVLIATIIIVMSAFLPASTARAWLLYSSLRDTLHPSFGFAGISIRQCGRE